MSFKEFTIKITKEKHPRLFELYKKDLNKRITQIFDFGYNAFYPDLLETEDTEIFQRDAQLNKAVDIMTKLLGIANNSSKKGELAENILEEHFEKYYINIKFKSTAKIPHSGDGWLYLPNNNIIMIESKNYTTSVNKDEVIKMENDMKTHNIKLGIFISWQSNINNFKQIDFNIFEHNKEQYFIVMISKFVDNFQVLDIAIKLLIKISKSNLINFTKNNAFELIKSDIENLQIILKHNTKLIDNYNILNKSIHDSLYLFEKDLRTYHYDIENIINTIIYKLNNNISSIIKINQSHIIKKYVKHKTYPILKKIIEFITIDNITYNETTKNNIIIILKQNKNIGTIKLLKYKIIVNFNKISDINFTFNNINNIDQFKILNASCKLI